MEIDRTVFAAKHKDASIRSASRSGGVFTALSDVILESGGVVYGCMLDESFLAVHVRATDKQTRDRMRGSKYIPSQIGDCYAQCAQDLGQNLPVLFSGTPCQIEALNGYLEAKNVPTESLVTVDILCHGVASPGAWKRFLEWLAEGEKIDSAEFRDKTRFGWTAYKSTIMINGNAKSSDVFGNLYYQNLLLPDACFRCRFKRTDRVSDVTLGDYWHLEMIDSQFCTDDRGVSLVLLNSAKGEDLFSRCAAVLEVRSFPFSQSLQPAMYSNYKVPDRRKAFFRALGRQPFDRLVKTYTIWKEPFYSKLIQIISVWKRKIAHG